MSKTQNVPARYVALLVRYLEQEGTDCAAALTKTGISRDSLRHTDAQLPTEQITSVTRLLTEASGGRRDLGLNIGAMLSPGQMGELGLAMLNCATIKDSLELCARYYALVTPSFAMRTSLKGALFEVVWQPIQAVPYDLLVMAYDIALMTFHTRMKMLLRDEMPGYDIYLFSPEPPDRDRYKALKPARCHFGQGGLPSLRILIDADVVTRTPMPMAHAGDLADIERRLAQRLLHHARQDQRDWKAWVTMMLTEAHGDQPTQDELADIVGLSTSTLARHLTAQGTSFRELANHVRHERACMWLRDGRLQVSDVASLLGYTHAANFIRAFKARAGVSPTRYAAQHSQP